jgi:predicted PurR-regulated permease PerM
LVLVLLAATALAVYVCCRLAEPFLPALAWALALAVVAHPLHTWLLRRLHRPSLAAGLAVGPVTLTITVALAEVWRRRTAGGRAAEAGVDE